MNRKSGLYKFLKKVEKPGKSRFFGFLNKIFDICLITYGAGVHKKLKKKYPGYTYAVMPCSSTGDLLFLKPAFDELIKRYGTKKYILVVQSNLLKISEVLSYKNICTISMAQGFSLNIYHRFMCDKLSDVINVYPWEMFDAAEIANNISIVYPQLPFDHSENKKMFEIASLVPKKTVVLSPYQQTLSADFCPMLSISFWEKLAAKLLKMGYSVCTNCKNDVSEPPIKGTKVIFPRYANMEDAVSYAGYLIAIRSGFVDYVCKANAAKVILYPNKFFFNALNVKRLGLSDDCYELIYGNEDEQIIFNKIITYFSDRQVNR